MPIELNYNFALDQSGQYLVQFSLYGRILACERFGDSQKLKVRHLLQLDVEEKKLDFFVISSNYTA